MDHILVESSEQASNVPKSEDFSVKERNTSDSSDKENISSEDRAKFNRLITKSKQLVAEGQLQMAIDLNKRALKISYHEKLERRIAKMEAYLKEQEEEEEEEDEEDNGMVNIGNDFYMFKELYSKLYEHQRQGVLWMWGLFRKKKGGILGDDMGLGKTIQVVTFLSGMFDMDKINGVLIVMPVSLMPVWEKEFKKWAPGIRVTCFHGTSKREKERALSKIQRRGGVCLTSYGMVVTSWEQLSKQEGREFRWDYMILDEGHKIKNPTKTTKGVHAIGARNRLILTGTPVQNNLRELWALFDFVHNGSLLGTSRTFKQEFENPITRARERDATVGERKLGGEMAESLKKIIAPYFLRRTKAEVSKKIKTENTETEEDTETPAASMPSLSRKNDFIVWLFLTQAQQQIYHDFISLDSIKELLMTKRSPLVALTVLKKITDHPRLLSKRACAQLGLDGEDKMDDSRLMESEEGHVCAANEIHNIDDEVLINESGKVIFIMQLLDQLKQEGHRTLLFSQSRKMLDIIEKIITNRGHKVMRLDGTVTHMCDRDQRIKKFQTDQSYSVFLLTTQVGGVGLTLTAADRVIIFDPSWNPATDAQAVDRVFRIGQNKNVVIYRLITCGTIEEKIYRRQVFKDSINRQTTGNTKNPYRYFTKQELKELFSLDNPRYSATQQQLEEMHSSSRNTDSSLDAHIAFLYSLDMFGITDHDLMFNHESGKMDDHFEQAEDSVETKYLAGNDYIQSRVQKAQELLKMESEVGSTCSFEERNSKYPRNMNDRPPRELSQWNFGPKSEQPYIPEEYENAATIKPKQIENGKGVIDLTTVDNESDSSGVHDDSVAIDLTEEEEDVEDEDTKASIKQETDCNFNSGDVEHQDVKREPVSPLNHSRGALENFTAVKQEPDSSSSEETSSPHTPIKSEVQSPAGSGIKMRRKSVSQSPWLSRTPKAEPNSPIVEEHIFISPDMHRPVVDIERTPLSSLIKGYAQKLNSTIFSTFMDSPEMIDPESSSSEEDSPSVSTEQRSGQQNNLYTTFVGDSPQKSKNNLCKTFVGETPGSDSSPSITIASDVDDDSDGVCVEDSFQESESKAERSSCLVIGDSDEDNDDDDDNDDNDDDDDDDPLTVKDTNHHINSSVHDVSMNSPVAVLKHHQDSNSVSNVKNSLKREALDDSMNSPIASCRTRKFKRAVIESSSEEEGSDQGDAEMESDIEQKNHLHVSSDEEGHCDMECSDGELATKGDKSHDDIKKGKILKESNKNSKFLSTETECDKHDSDEDEDGEEDTDMSGFIVDDDVEDTDNEEDDSEEGGDEDDSDNEEEQCSEEFKRLPEYQKSKYKEFVENSKSLLRSGSFEEALASVLQALEICPEPAVQALALKIHKKMDP